jgi:hypothetical protein
MLPKQILQIDTQLKWKKMAFIFEDGGVGLRKREVSSSWGGGEFEIIYSFPLYN